MNHDHFFHRLYNAMQEHNCKLLTTKDELNIICQQIKGGCPKVRYIASCGHEHNVHSNVFMGRLTGVKCPKCKKIEVSQKRKNNATCEDGQSINMKQEDDAIEYLKTIITPNFKLRKTVEGCLADLVIKPCHIEDDNWLNVQVKTTQKPLRDYGFNCSSRYKNCIILCICMSDKRMWILNGNNITASRKIAIGLKKSKYDQHEVTSDTIHQKILEYYQLLPSYTWNESNTPISIFQQNERNYRCFIESKCPFIQFEYTEKSNMVYDYTINGFKVQEKIGFNSKMLSFCLHKNKGKINKVRKFQPYKQGDNDFYWLNFPDKVHFFVIPESVLIHHGVIATDLQPGKRSIHINTKKLSENKFGMEYLFDYENIDIPRLKSLFGLS
jgi:hypothetical protein